MKKKSHFLKRALVAILVAASGLPIIGESAVFAAVQVETIYDTTPGISEFAIMDTPVILSENASIYDFFLPFDAKSVELTYSLAENAEIVLKVNDIAYSVDLAANSTNHTLVFDKVLRHSDITIEISSNKRVDLSQITFNKVNVNWVAPFMREEPNISQYEKDIQTASIIRMDSPVILVNGSKRYIDYNNITVCPQNIDGNIYLPAKALARAMGMYYEDYPEKNYCLMRMDNLIEIKALNRNCDIEHNGIFGTKEKIANPFVYVNGVCYAPVKKICEMIGKTVIYRNGLVVIDSSANRAKKIVDSDYLNVAAETLGSFVPANSGNTYYVAQTDNASDANDGTIENPFRTLEKAGRIAEAGDTVIIREGVYHEVLKPENNGTEAAPIIFKAMEGENVTVSAFDTLTGFSEVTKEDSYYNNAVTLLKANCPVDLGLTRNFVLYNGAELVQGRYPNVQTNDMAYPWPEDVKSKLWPTKGNIKVKSKYCNTPSHPDFRVYVSDTDLKQEDNYWKGATFVGEIECGWALTTGTIEYSTQGKIKLDNSSISFCWSQFGKNFGAFPSDYGYITNSIKTVDMPGEWQIENGYLYICPPDGETADTLSLDFKVRQNVIDLQNSKYVQVQNINTIGGGVNMNNSTMCVINGGNLKYLSHFIANNDTSLCYLDGKRSDWTTEPDNYMTRGELGICVGGTDCAIVNTKINYSAGAGILLYGKYAYIENNTLSDTGYGGAYFAGISCISEAYEEKSTPRGGFYIYNNTVKNTGRAAFYMSSATYTTRTAAEYEKDMQECDRGQYIPGEIAYNYFYNSNLIARDTGAYYIHGNNSGNDITYTKLHNNIICNVQGNDNKKDYFQPFACETYFYDDAWVAGINEYDNLGFATNDRQAYTSNEPVVGGDQWSEISTNSNNIDAGIIPDGLAGLKADDYPSGKPFFAGAFLDEASRFLKNYDGECGTGYDYNAAAAEMFGNVSLSNGKAVFDDCDAYIQFKNVDLMHEKNRLAIYYTGDRYNAPKLKVTVGNEEYNIDTNCRGYDTNATCVEMLDVAGNGACDIKILQLGGGEFGLYGINVIKDSISGIDSSNYIICGEFDDYITPSNIQTPLKAVVRNSNMIYSHNYCYAYNLFFNPTLIYHDVTTDEFNSIELSFQLDKAYDGTGVDIYMDDPESIPIFSKTLEGTNWNELQRVNVNLGKTYPSGTHNYYIKTTKSDDVSSTINLYSVKFYKEEITEEEYVHNYQYVNIAVNVDKISSDGAVGNGAFVNLIDQSANTYVACANPTSYIEFDMGRAYEIKGLELTLDFRINGYTLQASNDGENFTELKKINKEDASFVSGSGGVTDVYSYSSFNLDRIGKYRYYRIAGSTSAVMKLYDVKLFVLCDESQEGCKEVNIMEKNKPVYIVSDNATVQNEVERIYDGSLTTAAIVRDTEFVEFDLERLYDITAVKFVYEGRNGCGYKITASADGENYDVLYFAPRVTSYEIQYSGKNYIDKQKYRYIRIENINTSGEKVSNILFGYELSLYALEQNVN